MMVGTIDLVSVYWLRGRCHRAVGRRRSRLVIDLTAVTGCDIDGLVGLAEFAAGPRRARVVGARWAQFLPALLAVDYGGLAAERDRVRALIDPAAGHDRAPARAATPTPARATTAAHQPATGATPPAGSPGRSARTENPSPTTNPAPPGPDHRPPPATSPRVAELRALTAELDLLLAVVDGLRRVAAEERAEIAAGLPARAAVVLQAGMLTPDEAAALLTYGDA